MKRDDALPRKIAVLMGGPGSERDVSLATGHGVSKELLAKEQAAGTAFRGLGHESYRGV